MKLYFARHGHNDANKDSIPDAVSGEIDEPLNAIGIQQAHDLAEELKDVQFDAIISSPLERAYQTAEIVNEYHDLPIEINPAWREREIGAFVDLETWSDLFDFDKNMAYGNAESLKEFFDRVYSAIDDLKVEYAGKTVFIAAHGGVHIALYAYANNLPLQGNLRVVPLKNCEYKIYELV